MVVAFLTLGFIFFFILGYKHGRRVERWSQNHPPEDKEIDKDEVEDFLNNINKN